MPKTRFDWDVAQGSRKSTQARRLFGTAQFAFADPRRVIAVDTAHSGDEERHFCFGRVGDGILTVRFTYRAGVIRIIGAGYWRKGRQIYEFENQIHP